MAETTIMANLFKQDIASHHYANAVKMHLGVAEVKLRSCRHQVEQAKRLNSAKLSSVSANEPIALAIEHCTAAVQALISTRDRVYKFPENMNLLP